MAVSRHLKRMANDLSLPLDRTLLRASNLMALDSAAKAADLQGQTALRSLNERSWSDRVGDEFSQLFQSAAQAQSRASLAREMRSRSQRLGLVDPNQLADMAARLWGPGGENKLDTLARQAAFRLNASGMAGLEASLSARDPMERQLLLSKMAEHIGRNDVSSERLLQSAARNLQTRHGDELKALHNSAAAFDVLHHMDAPDADKAAGASKLRGIFLDAGRTAGDAVVSAPKLASELLAKFDGPQFEVALMQLGEGVLADLRSAYPSQHAERVAAALTNSGAFMNVRKALGLSRRMRSQLAALGEPLENSDAHVATKLLEEAEVGCADASTWAKSLLGAQQGDRLLNNGAALTSLRSTVTDTPLSWWSDQHQSARFQLLEELDNLASALNRTDQAIGSSIQKRLRASMPTGQTH